MILICAHCHERIHDTGLDPEEYELIPNTSNGVNGYVAVHKTCKDAYTKETSEDNIVTVTGDQYAISPGCVSPLESRWVKKVIQHKCSCGKTLRITIEEREE